MRSIKSTMRHHALRGVVWGRRSCLGCSGSHRTLKGAVSLRLPDMNERALIGVLAATVVLMFLTSASLVSAQFTSSASYVTRPQGPSSFQTYYGSEAGTYWPILNEREQCKERQDFVLQTALAGCQPAVVRSDLLAEQNVPVFCQIDALQINPLLNVKEIRSIGFDNREYPKDVATVGFHPARAALRTRDRLLGDPLINNIGYVVVILRKQPDERLLPNSVTVNLTAHLTYDAGNALGIGRTEFVLEPQSDAEWSDESQRQTFWNGKYAVRLLDADARGANIALYSGDRQVSSARVEQGQRSREIFVPGSTCKAALEIEYLRHEAGRVSARLAIGSYNGTDVIDVYEGSSFLNARCRVERIKADNATLGAGNVTIACPSGRVLLQLQGKAGAAFELFVQSDGSRQFPEQKGEEWLATIGSLKYNLTMKNELFVWKDGAWKKADTKTTGLGTKEVERIKQAMSGYRKMLQEGRLSEESREQLALERSWRHVEGVEGNFSAALEAFEQLVREYPAEQEVKGAEQYGKQALEEGIALAAVLGKEQQRARLMQMFVEKYGSAEQAGAYKQELARMERIDSTHASQAIEVDGRFRTLRLAEIRQPTRMSGADLSIDGRSVTLREGSVVDFRGRERAQGTLTLRRIEAEFIELSTTCPRESQAQPKNVLRIGDSTVMCGQSVALRSTDVYKVARIALIPHAWGTETRTNLTVRVGIEKRAIQLSPNRTLERVQELNKSIQHWEQISRNLGNVVTGLKAACFATAGTLTVKNFITGLSGKGFARQQLMRGEHGWTALCQKEVSRGESKSLDACFSRHAPDINREVAIFDAQIQEVNRVIEEQEKDLKKQTGIFSSAVDPGQAVPKYRVYLIEQYGNDVVTTDSAGRSLTLKELLSNERGYEDGEYSYASLRDLHYNVLLRKQGISETTKQNVQQRLETIGSGMRTNSELTKRHRAEQVLKQQGFAAPFTASVQGQGERYVDIVPAEVLQKTGVKFSSGEVTHSASVVAPPRKDAKTSESFNGGTYVLGLKNAGDGAYTIVEVLKKQGEGTNAVYIPHDSDSYEEIQAAGFASTYGLGTLYAQQQLSYFNTYVNPEVRFHDREPYKGMPAVVPLDVKRGWYAATKQTLPAFGGLGAFDASGRATSFWLCNVGRNGREQFFEGLGDDICEMINVNTGQPLNRFPGLSDEEARTLVKRATQLLEEASRQYGQGRSTLTGIGDVRVGKPAASIPSVQCQDFMTPQECNLLFNVCDPVICPATRCDFGGKYPVADVVQTGIIGSTLLCLPNFPEVKVPVCLTGIQAGIDSYLSVMKAHRDCLQESAKTGRMIGICDQLYSIYTCEFFWRQLAPLTKVLVPRLLETAYGQGVRGGGEYLTVMGAWQHTQQTVNYFTQTYGVNALKAFNARSTEEAGGEFCKSFISIRAPGSLKTVLAPDSPPQFYATFSSLPLSSVTVPATSQYKVYYHLFAGRDAGVYYRVYLRRPPEISYYVAAPIVQVASGFVKKGEYKDETRDFSAPEGYQELCVNINGEEKCGFKQVTSSFAVNYVRDALVAQEIKESAITGEKECISGSTSATAFLNPNLQQAAQEALAPEIYRRGVLRICATQNPGTGTNPERFVPVGRCDDEKVLCWLDRQSVDNAITDNNKGVRNATLTELERIQRENLEKGGVLLTQETAQSELNELSGMVEHLKERFAQRSGGGVSAQENEQAGAVLNRMQQLRDALYRNDHKARLLLLKGRLHGAVAQQLSEKASVEEGKKTGAAVTTMNEEESKKTSVEEGKKTGAAVTTMNEEESTTTSTEETQTQAASTTQPERLQVPFSVDVSRIAFTLDLNPANDLWGFDEKITVHYDSVKRKWVKDSELAGFDNAEADALMKVLSGSDFTRGVQILVGKARAGKGELQTQRVLYRGSGNDDFLMYEKSINERAKLNVAYREGTWMFYDGGLKKFVATGVPSSAGVYLGLFRHLQRLDRDSGAVLLFAWNDQVAYERVVQELQEVQEGSTKSATEPQTPRGEEEAKNYTLSPASLPSGNEVHLMYAGGIYTGVLLIGKNFFAQEEKKDDKGQLLYNSIGAVDEQQNIAMNEHQIKNSKASLLVQQHAFVLQGNRYLRLVQGSIEIPAELRGKATGSEPPGKNVKEESRSEFPRAAGEPY